MMSGPFRFFLHRRWPFLAGIGVILVLASLVLTGDPLYGFTVRLRHAQWERGIERDADGVRRGCRPFEVGSGTAALLLIHGFGDSPLVFRPLADRLAENGYLARAMRLPGFGEPMEQYRKADLDAWAAAVDEELSALRQHHAEVWMVGHSTGAAIALLQQIEGPSRADGLILLAPLVQVADDRSPLLPARTWFEVLRSHLRQTRYVENPFPRDIRDPEAGRNLPDDRFVPISIYTELFALIDRIENGASTIQVPVLMGLSPHDQVIDTAAAAAYFDDLASPRKRQVQFSESGHMMMIDSDRERVADAVHAFIRANEPGT
jgi:carboxylesterase